MKIVFNLPEDDPKNPGVIADCTGDNAGDSVGPTADGFETYGVTGVALIAFLALALAAAPPLCGKLIIWMFAIQSLMVLASLASFYVNQFASNARYGGKKDFNWEAPLTTWSGSPPSFPSLSPSSPASCCSAISTDVTGALLPESLVGAVRHHFLRHARRAR